MSRVAVAMSGGVDSAVAAALCLEAGHEVFGVTAKLGGALASGSGCCGAPSDLLEARRACEKLGLAHYVVDLADCFERTVVAPFIDEYLRQRTPNPCVECNRTLKFGRLLELCAAWKADFLATGHYARLERGAEGVRLLRGVDPEKDQSYFLCRLGERELSRALFPVGALSKEEVRAKARALGLANADHAESMEICFVPGGDYRTFLRARRGDGAFQEGEIRDLQGRLLGRHRGLPAYTIGQRRGLGLSSKKPLYVAGLDGATNTLLVGTAEETLRKAFTTGPASWTRGPVSGKAQVRVRHRGRLLDAELRALEGGGVRVELSAGERAVCPGQTAAFCRGDEVLGGATIEEVQ